MKELTGVLLTIMFFMAIASGSLFLTMPWYKKRKSDLIGFLFMVSFWLMIATFPSMMMLSLTENEVAVLMVVSVLLITGATIAIVAIILTFRKEV